MKKYLKSVIAMAFLIITAFIAAKLTSEWQIAIPIIIMPTGIYLIVSGIDELLEDYREPYM